VTWVMPAWHLKRLNVKTIRRSQAVLRSALDLSCGATAVEPEDLDMQALELHSHRVE
jgi:hypothetical protein